MRATKYQMIVVQSRRDLLSVEDVAARAGVHPDIVRRFIDFGLIHPADEPSPETMLDPEAVHRICVIQRLRRDLGINLPGIAVILDLLDRLAAVGDGGSRGYQ
jgi:chaperone modulatory protein CbpM